MINETKAGESTTNEGFRPMRLGRRRGLGNRNTDDSGYEWIERRLGRRGACIIDMGTDGVEEL
jgi:hypothetical protein